MDAREQTVEFVKMIAGLSTIEYGAVPQLQALKRTANRLLPGLGSSPIHPEPAPVQGVEKLLTELEDVLRDQDKMRGNEKIAGNIVKEEFHKGALWALRYTLAAFAALPQPEQPTEQPCGTRTVSQGRAVVPGAMQAWDEASPTCATGEE